MSREPAVLARRPLNLHDVPVDGRRRGGLIDRRALLAGVVFGALMPRPALAATPQRIAALDYGLTETLLALGVTPVAIAEADAWAKWVGEPPLPSQVANLGADREVNLELLSALKPDLILSTPYLAGLTAVLETIAPVLSLPIYTDAGTPLRLAEAAARRLGERLDRSAAADLLIARAGALFADFRRRFAARPPRPVLLINFVDERHARIYGRSSLYQDVMDRMGVANAWTRDTNYWGFATIGIETLADFPEAQMFAFEPISPDIRAVLARSPLWTRLPFVAAGRAAVLPAVLMFGALPSAMRFATLLGGRLAEISERPT